MKKILQDLSKSEIESLVLSLGEKKFRAAQLFEGMVQGKKITQDSGLMARLLISVCAYYSKTARRRKREAAHVKRPV